MGPRLGVLLAAALLLPSLAGSQGPLAEPLLGAPQDPDAASLVDAVRSPVTARLWHVYKTDDAAWVRHGAERHPSLEAAWRAEAQALDPGERALRKLSPALRAELELPGDDEVVRVFATLAEQPLVDLAPGVWARHEPELGPLRARLRAEPRDEPAARAFEQALGRARADLLGEARGAMARPQAEAAEDFAAQGWTVLEGGSLVNDLRLALPRGDLPLLAADARVARVDEDARLRTTLDVAPADMRAEDVWDAGQTGSAGTFDLAVLDTGLDAGHPAFAGKAVTAKTFHDAAVEDGCYDDDATTDDLQGHGTSVHSIAASGHGTYAGSAKGAPSIIHGKAGWRVHLLCLGGGAMYDSDGRKAANWSLTQLADPAEGVNLSFGSYDCEPEDGDTGFERFFDAVSFGLDVPVTIAAGNDGPDSCSTGSPCDAFNVLCLGNVDDKNTEARGDNAIAGSSSRGPTGDGRRKPDLAAPGTRLRSANHAWEDGDDWVDFTGTSMAAPIALGAVTLLQHGGVAGAKEVKALLLATAERDAPYAEGDTFGFGYIDVKRAWDHRDHVRSAEAASDGNLLYRLGGADAVALVWPRHMTWKGQEAPGATPLPISDLDLQVWDEADHSLELDETDTNDYHGGDVAAAEPVARVRTVSLASGLTGEAFALAATGAITGPFTAPALALTVSGPSSAASGEAFAVAAEVTNTGQLRAHGVRLNLALPAACSTTSTNPRVLATLDAGAARTASWTVSCTSGTPLLEVVADTEARQYGVAAPEVARNLSLAIATGPPTVALTEPTAGSVLGADFTARATATDDEGLDEVSVQLDGGPWLAMACTGSATSTSCTHAFQGVANGAHALRARACDLAGLCATGASVGITVQDLPPAVGLTAPDEGSWQRAAFTVAADAADDLGLASVRARVDDGAWQAMACTGPSTDQSCTKALEGVAEGARTLTAQACDGPGACTLSAPRGVVVDATAPSVAIARPAAGAVLVQDAEVARLPGVGHAVVAAASKLTLRAVASDGGPPGAAVVSVTFTLGVRFCTATGPSFECSVPLGGYVYAGTLTARAVDRAGNAATHSRPVVVVT